MRGQAGRRPALAVSIDVTGFTPVTAPPPFQEIKMKRPPDPYTREPQSERPQPLAGPGVQRPQNFQDEEEADAFSRWLAHVEAGRIG